MKVFSLFVSPASTYIYVTYREISTDIDSSLGYDKARMKYLGYIAAGRVSGGVISLSASI